MSHFSVLIALPAGTDLAAIEDEIEARMQRWNEEREVEPYRDYEEGSAGEFWWVDSVRRGAEEARTDAPSRVRYDEMFKWWSIDGAYHFDTEAEAIAFESKHREADAEWAHWLGDAPTWETVVDLYNERFGHGKELAATDDGSSTSETMFYEAESDRAYTMSTRNPEGLWDYWRIGGRWGKGYFLLKEAGVGTVRAADSWDSPSEAKPGIRADGAPKRLIDFEGMREQADVAAMKRWNLWETFAAQWPPARGWSHFRDLASAGQITWDEARAQYGQQPVIAAQRADRGEIGEAFGWDCPIDEFATTKEEYGIRARRAAVPGYALVTLDGEWVAPGRMGWFGMSSDGPGEQDGYQIGVNEYIDSKLADDDLLVVLDCHV